MCTELSVGVYIFSAFRFLLCRFSSRLFLRTKLLRGRGMER